jgi:hypothetical protein
MAHPARSRRGRAARIGIRRSLPSSSATFTTKSAR